MNSEVPLWPHTKRVTIIGGAFARERHRDRLGRTAVVREGAGLAAASRDSSRLRYLGSVVASRELQHVITGIGPLSNTGAGTASCRIA